jgi:hypothetical protein
LRRRASSRIPDERQFSGAADNQPIAIADELNLVLHQQIVNR